MRPYRIRVNPKSNDRHPHVRQGRTRGDIERNHVSLQAEIGATQPEAANARSQLTPEATKP